MANKPRAINVGIIGYGTVGSGVTRILVENRGLIKQRLGTDIVIKKICDVDITRDRGIAIDSSVLTTNSREVIEDPGIDIIVETVGGIDIAKEIIMAAIGSGKHVVTANKALLAEAGDDIFAAAHRTGVDINFEAAVGGGIPIIRTLKEGLVGDRIEYIFGIMNGTCNYILTRMTDDDMEFSAALAEAQRLGYAEADPTLDIEGYDTAHKLAVIIPLTYGVKIDYADIHVEGISNIQSIDIRFAREMGYKIKLLAILVSTPGGIEARVHPTLIPFRYLLSNVNLNMNAFYIRGAAVGSILLYGQGAGRMPTGTAVVSDLVELARNVSSGIKKRVPPLSFSEADIAHIKPKKMDDVVTNYYLRFSALDKPGVLSKIAGILGDHNISIASVIQKGRAEGDRDVPVVIMTHEARERDVKAALATIDGLDIIVRPSILVRVEDTAMKGGV
ncbi:MAG: homoserine dehydrogenase [Deltaproteobacteria bacterium]|nr:homoserine dehydrogenase [Candidatus Zymogenaceae bacterium]